MDDQEGRHRWPCGCTLCRCRSWLGYRPEEERWPLNQAPKITSYGGTVSVGGEPDAGTDPTVWEADCRRALALIPSRWHALVGKTWRETPPGKGKRVWLVIARLARRSEWNEARLEDMGAQWSLEGDKAHPATATLHRLLDECALQMATVMGERAEGRPAREPRAVEPEPMPEWDGYTAQRRYE